MDDGFWGWCRRSRTFFRNFSLDWLASLLFLFLGLGYCYSDHSRSVVLSQIYVLEYSISYGTVDPSQLNQ